MFINHLQVIVVVILELILDRQGLRLQVILHTHQVEVLVQVHRVLVLSLADRVVVQAVQVRQAAEEDVVKNFMKFNIKL